MTETRRKHLHLGKCIEDLDKLHNVPDLKTKRLPVLCKSALKLFERAEEFHEKGDEEYAYVYYMKYLRVIAFLTAQKEFQKDKNYFNGMIGPKNPNKALDTAEILKKSLIDRYAVDQSPVLLDSSEEEEKMIETVTTVEPVPTVCLPGLDEVTITCEQLYPILKARQLKVMILDCRPGKDYLDSHINYPTCISVPEECISPGQSANVLEQNLPASSRRVWADRALVELIVMLDWSSTKVIPGTTLFLLKTILLKWDVKVHYSRPPLGLAGGYEEWLLKYPALTTNPQVVPPRQADLMDDMLGEIDYPNWNDLMPVPTATPPARPQKSGEPFVDRSSKAAAVAVYDERARSMQQILSEQERIVDHSLTLQMQRIEAEQAWEVVSRQRETEVRDEVRAMYKLREQEIISQLMLMENKQFDMELENQRLRDKLEEYQRKERGLGDPSAVPAKQPATEESMLAAREISAKRARIAAVTQQRDKLDRRRELLEAERKRKLDEARNKKKPDLDKDEEGDTYMKSPDEMPSTTSLNRSMSSPNLANDAAVSEEEEEEGEGAVPSFDRSTKPVKETPPDARPRINSFVRMNFEPLFEKVVRGLTGLKNLGNTCYMNSILQCLSNTAGLNYYFQNGHYRKHINRTHSTRGAVAEQFAAVVCALWSGQCKHIAAKELRNEMGKHQRAFRGCDQQDSHEFLTILMDWLHNDLMQIEAKPPPRETWTDSDKAWYEYLKGKESLISRLFYGQIKSTVRCTVCGKTSVTFDTFSNLSLELPPNALHCTLRDCLRLYLNDEKVYGWNCPGCKEKREAVKKLDISRRPPVLVVHFKRFYCDNQNFRKRQTLIHFPLENLDMEPFTLAGSGRAAEGLYDLYAVSNHYGDLQGGHYTAICKAHGRWYRYDDHVVNEISENDVISSAAYILFYAANSKGGGNN